MYAYRGSGLLYTHTVRPLTRHRDPVTVPGKEPARGNMKQLEFQYVSIVWDENAIGEIARKGGIETIHFADVETRSYILGIWRRHTLRVYGTGPAPPAPPECPGPLARPEAAP